MECVLDLIKKLSKKMFLVIFIFSIIFAGSVYAGLFYKLQEYEKYVIAGISGYFVLFGGVLFLVLNAMVKMFDQLSYGMFSILNLIKCL